MSKIKHIDYIRVSNKNIYLGKVPFPVVTVSVKLGLFTNTKFRRIFELAKALSNGRLISKIDLMSLCASFGINVTEEIKTLHFDMMFSRDFIVLPLHYESFIPSSALASEIFGLVERIVSRHYEEHHKWYDTNADRKPGVYNIEAATDNERNYV